MEEVNKAEVNQPIEEGKNKREKNLIPMRTYEGMSEEEKKDNSKFVQKVARQDKNK